jgi:autotransporter-associated beta strand protein
MNKIFKSSCVIAMLFVLAQPQAMAETKTWNGSSSNGNAANGGNWVGGVAPVANTDYDFVFSSSNLTGSARTGAVWSQVNNGFDSLYLYHSGTNGFTLTQSTTNTIRLKGSITVAGGYHVSTLSNTVTSATSTWDIAASSKLTMKQPDRLTLSSEKVINKTGAGTLALEDANNNIAGTIRLSDGILRASGQVTALGSGTAKLELNGGTLELVSNVNGAWNRNTKVGGNATVISDRGAAGDGTIQTLGTLDIGANTLTVKAGSQVTNGTVGITFGATVLSGDAVLNVTNNVANVASKLTLGAVSGAGKGLTKIGDGTLQMDGVNTYSGDTTVSAGNLLLADNAGLTFVVGASNINNKLTGNGNATLSGDFYFNLTSAGTTAGDSWIIEDLAGTVAYQSTFSVNGFTDAGGDKWTKDINGTKYYQFDEGTGILTVIPEPATIGMLGLGAIIAALLRRLRN